MASSGMMFIPKFTKTYICSNFTGDVHAHMHTHRYGNSVSQFLY